ncbi:MAG: DUF11 domain-containing protein [Acidimicrobiia bacterium]
MRFLRSRRAVLVVAIVAALGAVSAVAIAGALITTKSGSVIQLSSPPPSVAYNALESPTSVYAFTERTSVALPAPVAVDAVAPGTYTRYPNGNATIPAGTIVDSHLIHSDATARGSTTMRTGSVTFDGDVVGVIGATARIAATDATLGAPGTVYGGTTQFRGLENSPSSGSGDRFTISSDHRTVSFVLTTPDWDEMRIVTQANVKLTTLMTDSPDPVTAGNDVQYTLTVRNDGTGTIANAHVVDTLPPDTSLVATSAPGPCTGTGPVDCSLGSLAPGDSAVAFVVVTSPSEVPAGGTITNTAVATPGGSNVAATEITTVEAATPGVSKGFVIPGGSIGIDGDDPATVTLPDTGTGAPILITQGPGTFCDGPCSGTATTVSEFDGYDDPNHPIHLELVYTFSGPDGLTQAATAFGSTIYKNTDPNTPNVGTPVPACTNPGTGVAAPHPCIDAHTITEPSFGSYEVRFQILYLSGDPKFALR